MGSDWGIKAAPSLRQKTLSCWFLRPLLMHLISFAVGMMVSYYILVSSNLDSRDAISATTTLIRSDSASCVVSLSKYRGNEYTTSATVGAPKCLVESKFLKVQQHKVTMPQGDIIDDWLFIDYHDRINVLVEAPRQDTWTEPHYYVFQQTKYALEDRMSLAVVGGIVEPSEKPEQAARREVSEEMHVLCHTFVFLGRYRTDVNRGGGWTSTYLAKECQPGTLDGEGLNEADEVGVPDTERQDLQTISLTDMRKVVSDGKFLEIQWTATVALAALHETASH